MDLTGVYREANILYIIIYLYKIAILHHGMQSFHNNRLLHACLLHARLLHGCDVTHISSIGRFATSISLREHANERYAECLGMNWCSKHLIIMRYIIIRLLNSYSVLGPRSLVGLITSQAR